MKVINAIETGDAWKADYLALCTSLDSMKAIALPREGSE